MKEPWYGEVAKEAVTDMRVSSKRLTKETEREANMDKFSTTAAPSVHIEVSVLDSLMNLAEELVLCRNQPLQAISEDDRHQLEIFGRLAPDPVNHRQSNRPAG